MQNCSIQAQRLLSSAVQVCSASQSKVIILTLISEMLIGKQIRRAHSLSKIIKQHLITHKFYFGQGGELQLDLKKREYNISVQTIWQDHCLLQIEGLTGIQNFVLAQEKQVALFNDTALKENFNQTITVKLKIPEDYTLNGAINGSVDHIYSQVGKNLRSNPFQLNILGDNHSLSLGNVKSEDIKVTNQKGLVNFAGLTIQNGSISAYKITSKKIMTSKYLAMESQKIDIVSLLMFGPSKGVIKSKQAKIQSIGGDCQIQSEKLRIDRYYGGSNSINIKCKQIDGKLGIETGSGTIQFEDQSQATENYNKVHLGRLHKGKMELRKNKIDIL